MRTLRNTLHDLDAGDLRIIAERWGVEVQSPSGAPPGDQLATWILQPDNLTDFLSALTDGETVVLGALRQHAGRIPLDQAERLYGAWRRMGPARRDRMQPHRNPTGPLESLGYSGLIGRAFADQPSGPQEFVFIPSDVLPLLPAVAARSLELQPSAAPEFVRPAVATAVEDCVTLLAALRRRSLPSLDHSADWCEPIRPFLLCPESATLLLTLLIESGVLTEAPHRPRTEQTGQYLQSLHDNPHRPLDEWRSSRRWNDLSHLPNLACETREWPGDTLLTRQALLELLDRLPRGTWFELDHLVQAIRNESPGFQRTAGEFDAWYLRDRESGAFLRGFDHWDDVEGALIRFVIRGPLHWLGIAHLGSSARDRSPDRFRLSQPESGSAGPIHTGPPPAARIDAEGVILAPIGMHPVQRYQLARFCDWEGLTSSGFGFRLSPSSMRLASGQGLRSPQVVALLESATGHPLAPHLQQALARANTGGPSPRFEEAVVLRMSDAGLLEALLASKATARYLGERVGKDGIVVRPGEWSRLRSAAAKLGILIDRPSPKPPSPRRG